MSTDNNDINILLSLEILLPFNTNNELSQNLTEKQIIPFKTKVN